MLLVGEFLFGCGLCAGGVAVFGGAMQTELPHVQKGLQAWRWFGLFPHF